MGAGDDMKGDVVATRNLWGIAPDSLPRAAGEARSVAGPGPRHE
jgi:hypothetical protein